MGRLIGEPVENQPGKLDSTVFSRIESSTVYLPELVMEKILDSIRLERLRLGSILPPERKMAKDLGVSRNALRECLAIMDYLGITERQNQRRVLVRSSDYYEKICTLIEYNKL